MHKRYIIHLQEIQNRFNKIQTVFFTDVLQNDVWQWADGSSFGFSYWCDGEPNNGGGRQQDCLQMNYSGEIYFQMKKQ